jgi:hypothetical protein
VLPMIHYDEFSLGMLQESVRVHKWLLTSPTEPRIMSTPPKPK